MPVRLVLVSCGVVLLGLGAVGIALPGLPATPFLLLASYCLARSSPAFHAALARSSLFGPILRDWEQHRMVRRAVKVRAIAIVLAGLAVTIGFAKFTATASAAVTVCALMGVLVIALLPSERR